MSTMYVLPDDTILLQVADNCTLTFVADAQFTIEPSDHFDVQVENGLPTAITVKRSDGSISLLPAHYQPPHKPVERGFKTVVKRWLHQLIS